ncbi:glycosyl transferase family 4 [Algoriphagus ratkowskyi]|uniref:Glycosyl transferase family 4 n=1 Tax=Algoriphagus ratkowskyi TaxID=57028 RepID=A0A2W7RF74_9BACT|nr:glycosyltransferase [Algoriphagus ratkowskyi]PZX57776.1 glycosyl transferase family 4 [Algoriphagus ratkowskyi]TXD79040.1 glycosyltransferase family 4 protein [Algoriphagus ratkowskyi]
MKILIFTINPLHNAPRVIREIDALKNNFEIIATGITPPHDKNIEYIDAEKFVLSSFEYTLGKIFRVLSLGRVFKGRYPSIQSKIDRLIRETNPDIVIVHPGAYLSYFSKANRQYKLVFNAHEFHPKEFESDQRWKSTWGKIHDHIYRTHLPKIDLLINVCEGIGQECKTAYGRDSIIIPNAGPYYPNLKPKLRSDGKIRMIHHGVAIKERSLENMIELAGRLEVNYELDMMLVYQDQAYFDKLTALASNYTNVRIIPPVAFDDIVSSISEYDIGLFLLPPANFNYLHALPNKFFEFIQARLAIAVGPSPEMANVVKEYELGIVSSDFSVESMHSLLSKLSHDEINTFKRNSNQAAMELNAEQYNSLLLSSIQSLNN